MLDIKFPALLNIDKLKSLVEPQTIQKLMTIFDIIC